MDNQKLRDKQIQTSNERQRLRDDYKKVMETPEGRRLLWAIISAAGVHRANIGRNEAETNVFIGRRQIGNGIVHAMKDVDLQLYHVMESECRKVLLEEKIHRIEEDEDE